MNTDGDVMITNDFVFFWSGWPSQWYKSPFTIDGVTYGCCEQYMMAMKARTFKDSDAEAAIMATPDPRTQKAIGRSICNFKADAWGEVCRDIVLRGNLAKFSQNELLLRKLINTGDRVLAEASPYDLIWGIGLRSNHPDATSPNRWPGKNWLGIALMEVRRALANMA